MAATTQGETRIAVINVFTVEPANQQRLIDLLAEATERSVRHAAGFISARLHRSLDGTKVTFHGCRASREVSRPTPLYQSGPRLSRSGYRASIAS